MILSAAKSGGGGGQVWRAAQPVERDQGFQSAPCPAIPSMQAPCPQADKPEMLVSTPSPRRTFEKEKMQMQREHCGTVSVSHGAQPAPGTQLSGLGLCHAPTDSQQRGPGGPAWLTSPVIPPPGRSEGPAFFEILLLRPRELSDRLGVATRMGKWRLPHSRSWTFSGGIYHETIF